MPGDRAPHLLEAALREERALVLAFGGFGIELAGGTLVLNERIAAPAFNFVQEVSVSPKRISGFLEKALDQYFQRALRPSVRVPAPSEPGVRRALALLGFVPRPEDRTLHMAKDGALAPGPAARIEVRLAAEEEFPQLLGFWVQERGPEPEEFLRCLRVGVGQPHPEERLRPVVALVDNQIASAALLHAYRGTTGIHAVTTRPGLRQRGVASALVARTARELVNPPGASTVVWADSDRLRRRLEALAFPEIARYDVYELPATAELSLPPPGPSTGPLWRPPRGAGRGADPAGPER